MKLFIIFYPVLSREQGQDQLYEQRQKQEDQEQHQQQQLLLLVLTIYYLQQLEQIVVLRINTLIFSV